MKILENIRNKPDHVKYPIMWVGVFLIMVIIFSFWLINFSAQVSQAPKDESTSEIKNKLPSVWDSLKSQTGLLFGIIKNLGK